MATPAQLRFLKDRLASLASTQAKANRGRKRLAPADFSALRREITGTDDPSWSAAHDVLKRRIAITACLNLYHEIRGSGYRHGVRNGWEWSYEMSITLLRQHLAGLA